MNKKTIHTFLQMKKDKQKIVMLTCYDYVTAKLLSSQDIDILLVGDSLATVKLGHDTTLPVTVDNIIYHTQAVKKGNDGAALIAADMPFLSYETSVETAVFNAGRLLKEGGANAVKLEGGLEVADKIKAISAANIPVIGHLGLTPQGVNKFGGFKVQARSQESKERLISDAKALQDAGAFMIVIEAVPEDAAKEVSNILSIPTIGIGAGKYCDGQVLVVDDMLGMFTDFTPKFVKKYADLASIIKDAVKNYAGDVRNGVFPGEENTYK
ncbi:MAG: 3-methyl-2-oxobutanoate hydroxymethyltransferase [Endomicrobium sp.]|jgi:3-methyl-2-oxobutanoate hydroxymethyltransferase|nr:3-methyl-2-oxobutanoate hydroxymethyltransferase [Endomicrobium sp.]